MEWSHRKKDPSWNSSPRLVDLTSFSAPLELVEHLRPAWLITSELPETKWLWHSLNSWQEHRWFSQLIVLPSHSVHPRCPQLYLLCSTLYYRLFLSLPEPQCGLSTQSFSVTVSSGLNLVDHWPNHVTLVMLQSVQFLEIIICNASNARIGLPIGANS